MTKNAEAAAARHPGSREDQPAASPALHRAPDLDDAEQTFTRYEQIRPRLPRAVRCGPATPVASLRQIAGDADAFVFDAFGVLNVGDTPIPGARTCVDALREAGKQVRVLTNAASYDHAGACAKFGRLGFDFAGHEIITSRDATLRHLGGRRWGVIAAPDDRLADLGVEAVRLTGDGPLPEGIEGILFLSAADWTAERQARLEAGLRARPLPVLVANADLVAPRGQSLSREPGYYGHLLLDHTPAPVRFFGKPFPEVYDLAEHSLPGIARERIVMCGDTLHTDILGAQAHGWKTALITRDGLFAGLETAPFVRRSGISPDWTLERI